jgi:hypothetical protein
VQSATFSKFIAPGVYQIKETGGVITASVDRLLADGSMLLAPENGHLLATIDAVIHAEYPRAPSALGQQGASISALVSNFGILVQWMKVRGLHYFGHLTDSDLRAFIYDSSCGLDAVLQSQKRMKELIERRIAQKKPLPAEFSRALEEIGIPASQARTLPAAKAMFQAFVATGRLSETRAPKPKQVSIGVLWSRANAFQLLWSHRDALADALSFAPSVSDIAKQVNRWGRPVGSTRALPVDYTCQLVGLAFRWVYEYGPLLADLQRVTANLPKDRDERRALLVNTLAAFNAEAEARGWELRLHGSRKAPAHGHLTWFVATSTYLPIACFIICGIFTARRMTELVSIRSQSVRGTQETGYWYTSYLGKRAKDQGFPCTYSVVDAIRALAYLKELRGIDAGEPAFAAIRGKQRLGQRLRNGLATFGRLVRAGLPEGMTHWNLAAHQFRKIFALIYRWRYDHPSLIALSVYFGHVSLKHIQAYTSSKEWKRDYQEAGQQFTLEKLRDIALGKVEPKGIFGKSLQRAIARALSQVELVDESEQVVVLTKLIRDRQIDLRATRWGYCGAKSAHSNLRRAACSTQDIIRSKATIDPEASSEDKCAGCLFFCTDSSRRVHWVTKPERLRTSATVAPSGSMAQTLMFQRLDVIERFARNNFGEEKK